MVGLLSCRLVHHEVIPAAFEEQGDTFELFFKSMQYTKRDSERVRSKVGGGGGGGRSSGGSRGFLLVLKNYIPFRTQFFLICCSLALKQDQIVSELLSKFHMHNKLSRPSPLCFT